MFVKLFTQGRFVEWGEVQGPLERYLGLEFATSLFIVSSQCSLFAWQRVVLTWAS